MLISASRPDTLHQDAAADRLDRDAIVRDLNYPAGHAVTVDACTVEDAEFNAFMGGPGTWRRIGAANEIVYLADRFVPIDRRMLFRTAALIGCLALVLLNVGRIAGPEEVADFRHGLDGGGIDFLEVEIDDGVVRPDLAFPVQENIALIQAVGGVEPGKAGPRAPMMIGQFTADGPRCSGRSEG